MTYTEQTFRKHRANPVMWFLAALALLLSVPTWFPEIAEREGDFMPVITDVKLSGVQKDGNHIKIQTVSFEKLRHCEFLRLAWFDEYGRRHALVSEPPADFEAKTFPPGRYEFGPWWVLGLNELPGSHAVAMHRCHPFWTTISEFHPSKNMPLYVNEMPTELAD